MPRARRCIRRSRIVAEPVAAAKLAGLTYVSDAPPGIARRRAGKSFTYVQPQGTRVRDAQTLTRIRSLAIPPAWTDVWICPTPSGHLQAVGRDARGRKQYLYHARWRSTRDESKYARMPDFARALPNIRARVASDLARPGLPREKILATVVRLLETTLIRIGNEAYARQNGSFGLTTMRNRHVAVSRSVLRFQFRGKGGKAYAIDVRDPRLALIVRQCQELPGQELFRIDSADVNTYLRSIAGEEFTAKDFRTWAGTVLAARALAEEAAATSKRQARRTIARAVQSVASRLGNTPAVCRKGYVHPAVIDAYLDGVTLDAFRGRPRRAVAEGVGSLATDERIVLALLQQRLPHARETARAA